MTNYIILLYKRNDAKKMLGNPSLLQMLKNFPKVYYIII